MIPLFPLVRAAGVLVVTAAGAAKIFERRRKAASPFCADGDDDPRVLGAAHDESAGDEEETDPVEPWIHPSGRFEDSSPEDPFGGSDDTPGPWLDLFGRDLRRIDLSTIDLVCADLRRTRLGGCRLSGRDLTGALLTGAELDRAVLRDAVLTGVDLDWASLRHADLSGADLNGASLVEADLKGADLSAADLSGARNLASAVLRGARASRATLWPPEFDPVLAGVEWVR